MKKIIFIIGTFFLVACCTSLHAQTDAEMKKWMDYMTPGDIHKMLAKSDGEWNAEMTSWMAPNTPPTKSILSCTSSMIMGGRYQQQKMSGSFANMPFEGLSTVAYDNSLKKFISTWIDNMGTGIIVMEGNWDNATKSLTTRGKTVDPTTGKEMELREVFKIIDDNTQLIEMYDARTPGKEFKSMEIKLTRKK